MVTLTCCSGAVLSAENAGGDTGATEINATILCKRQYMKRGHEFTKPSRFPV
jgi:hypothetical protein